MNVTPAKLVLTYLLYSVASIALYAITAGGWSTLFTSFFYSLFFYLPMGIAIIAVIALWALRSQKEGVLPKGLLIAGFALQAVTLLFNRGDCGDAPGNGYLFFERFLGAVCDASVTQRSSEVLGIVSSIPFILYMAVGYALLYKLAKVPKGLVAAHVDALWKRAARFALWAVIVLMSLPPFIFVLNFIEQLV